MKKLIILSAILSLFAFPCSARYQRGYYKPSTQKYVAGHYKTNSDYSTFNNYSTKGNTNPYTGKKGTVNPYKIKTYKTRY